MSFTYDDMGLLTGAQRQRVVNGGTPDVVRQVTYGYDALLGQLRSAEVKDGAGVTLRRFHYRYYTTTEPGSYLGMLKLAIGPRNYARAVQAGLDPESTSTTDAQLLPFADKVFQYDNQRRVTQQVLRTPDVDGSGTYTYAYTARSSPPGTPGPNDWLMQFVETQPDGSVNTVFTNQAGDVLFKQTQASSGGAVVAVDAYSYTSQWRLAWHITGAALQPVSGAYFSTSYTDLIGLVDAGGGWLNGSPYVRDTVGLIERWTYYTTTGSGAADGYIDQALVQQGELGTPTLVKRYTYTSHTKP